MQIKSQKKLYGKKESSLATGQLNEIISKKGMPKYIRLESGTCMILRNRPLILRIHASKKKEYLESIYSELLLFLPWKRESDLKENNPEECLALFNQNDEIIKRNKGAIFPNTPMVDAMMEMLDAPDGTRPRHLADDIDPIAQHEDLSDEEELNETNPLDTSDLPIEMDDKPG